MSNTEPPYKGDKGFKNVYLPVKDMASHVLDMFVNEYKSRYKNMKDINDLDFNEFKYIVLLYRKDGYVHDWVFASKKVVNGIIVD